MGLFDIFSSGDAQDAANAKISGLNAGYGQAADLFGQGRDAITNYYGQARAPFNYAFNNLNGTGTNGYQAYGDATGANGSAGNARATQNFQANPGYQFQFDQGLQAIDRGAASKGILGSGNTLNAEQQFGTGLANQSYQQYVQNLAPYMNTPTQQTSAATNSGYYTAGEGNALNSSYGNQGNLAYQTQAGIGNANASADMAKYGASQNMWGALMGGANMLAGGLPDLSAGFRQGFAPGFASGAR